MATLPKTPQAVGRLLYQILLAIQEEDVGFGIETIQSARWHAEQGGRFDGPDGIREAINAIAEMADLPISFGPLG